MDRLARELRVVYELARVVAAGPYEVGDILERICAEVRAAFGFERAMLVRYNAEDRTVHAVVQQGIDWPGDEWLQIEKFSFLEEARVSGRAVYVEDPRTQHSMPGKIIERFGVHSVVAIPLAVEHRCVGFLVADQHGGRLELKPADLELLTALGSVAAVLIDKADQYAELQGALDELRRIDQVKSDFISIASHELRTPIAVVHGIASTLHLRGDELESSQLVELRSTLFEQTSRLSALTEQLLDLSRIESGSVTVRPARFHPRERVDGLLQRIAPDRLGDITVAVSPELEVFTDPDGFERVVSNLVMNALRYGEPPVEVRSELGGAFRLVVQDHGDGVDPELVPRLFDRFARGRESHLKSAGGAGLGLAIARSFAQALGGELTYESLQPKGARFVLALPAVPG